MVTKVIFVSFEFSWLSSRCTSHLLFLMTHTLALLPWLNSSQCDVPTVPPPYSRVEAAPPILLLLVTVTLIVISVLGHKRLVLFLCLVISVLVCLVAFVFLCLFMKMLVNKTLCWCENSVTTFGPKNRNEICHNLMGYAYGSSFMYTLLENSTTKKKRLSTSLH